MTTLRVMSWRGGWATALEQQVSAPFTAATGIRIEPVYHVGLKLPATLTASLEAGTQPPLDLVWSNTVPALDAAHRDWCLPLDGVVTPGELHGRAVLDDLPGWPVAQAYVTPYVLVYRKALFPQQPPRSWSVLTRPEHAGRVVLYPGGNGFYPVAQMMGGGSIGGIPDAMEPCWSFVERMRPQLGRSDYSIGLEAPIRAGQIDLLYRALPNALAFAKSGADVGWAAPEEGVADTTDAFWIPRGVSEENAAMARRYIAYALSAAVQERWCAALGVLPMTIDAKAPALFRDCPGLPNHAGEQTGTLYVPESMKRRLEPQWEQRFDAIAAPRRVDNAS